MTRSTVSHAKHKTVSNVTGKTAAERSAYGFVQALGCLLLMNCTGARHNYALFSLSSWQLRGVNTEQHTVPRKQVIGMLRRR